MGRKLFNLKNIAMVVVFSLIAFVGFSAFTTINNKTAYKDAKTTKVFASQWYNIDATSDDTDDQEILSTTGSQPSEPNCNDENDGVPCAVQISFPGSVPSGLTGKTVTEVLDENEDSFVVLYTREIPE